MTIQQRREERRRALVDEMHGLGKRPVTFKRCPRLLQMIMAGRDDLNGSHRQQIIMMHQRKLIALTEGLTLDEKVPVVERYLDNLSSSAPRETNGPGNHTPLTSYWGEDPAKPK